MPGYLAHVLSRPSTWHRRVYDALDRSLAGLVPEEQIRRDVAPLVCIAAASALLMLVAPVPLLESLGEASAKLLLSWAYPVSLWRSWRELAQAKRESVVRGRRNALLVLVALAPLYAWCMRELFQRGVFDEL